MPSSSPNQNVLFSGPLGRLRSCLRASACACLLMMAGVLPFTSCNDHSGPQCQAGQYCACGNGPDCYLDCHSNGCVLECSHTPGSCGTICENQCTSTCHDTNECSQLCGDGCALECHNVVACGAQCGSNCVYSCHDASRCGVRVGPGSIVTCDHLTTCEVECAGACNVTCTNINNSNNCTVTCAAGHVLSNDGNGHLSCS